MIGLIREARSRAILLFVGLVIFVCAPIWSVEYFVNQDGSPHLYNAYLALELLKGNAAIEQFAAINPDLIPNLTGHWGLALLLLIFEPFTVTKIAVTLLFSIFLASVAWLRYQVSEYDGMDISLLLGAAFGLNWLWLLGFYNFILAAAAFAFTLGLWWRWRERITPTKGAAIWLLLVFTFFSHLVSFAVLIACLGFLALIQFRSLPKRSVWSTFALLVLTVPLLANYLAFTSSGGEFTPHWQSLASGITISNVAAQVVAADPFTIMSRRAIPFSQAVSGAFALVSPSFWLIVSLGLLILGSFKGNSSVEKPRVRKLWFVLSAILVFVWLFAPDDFGVSHGGYLRERILILGLVCLIPFFRLTSSLLQLASTVSLIFIILFQTSAIWEYSVRSEATANEVLPAKISIEINDAVAGIYFVDRSIRFRPIPEANFATMLGIGKNGTVWDNYEFGFRLFPVITRTDDQREFVSRFREASTYDLSDPKVDVAEKISRLDAILEKDHQRIDVLLVWNELQEIGPVRDKWFMSEPYFVSGRLRAYRHR